MRFGIIGTNFITESFLQAAKHCEDFQLQTVYSRSLQKAQEFAQKWQANNYTDSLQALAEDENVQAVYIASPNSLHTPQALQMLCAKKHVLCEKPMAPSAKQLQQMFAAATQNNVVLLEAMRPAFMPSLAILQSAMQKIGQVRNAQISYCQYSSRYDKFKQGIIENAFDPTFCNGALMDIGVYCIHMMLMLFGVPQKVLSAGCFLPQAIDAVGSALCVYPQFQVQLTYSKVHQSNQPSQIQAENGTLFFAPSATPYKAWIEYKNGEKEELCLPNQDDDMQYEIRKFIQIASGKESAKMWNTYSQQAIEIMDIMREQMGIDFTKNH